MNRYLIFFMLPNGYEGFYAEWRWGHSWEEALKTFKTFHGYYQFQLIGILYRNKGLGTTYIKGLSEEEVDHIGYGKYRTYFLKLLDQQGGKLTQYAIDDGKITLDGVRKALKVHA